MSKFNPSKTILNTATVFGRHIPTFAADIKIDVRVGTPDNIPERRIQSYVRNQFKSDQNQNLADR